MRRTPNASARIVLSLVVATGIACGSNGSGPGGQPAPTPTAGTPPAAACPAAAPTGFRVIGYLPSWQGSVEDVDFARLTHVNYAFALPTPPGGLRPVDDLPKLQALVRRAHQRGVRVSLSVGGWNDGDDSAFTALASSPATRRGFATTVAAFVAEQGLDGADIDWEYPEPEERASYAALIGELSARLRPAGKLLTAAVTASSYGSGGVGAETFPDFDWLNVMAYDGGNGADHSPYSFAVSGLDYWAGRGLPREKTVLGVPFYSRPGWRSYAWLVQNYPDAPNRDEVGGEYYNGIDTMQKKTCLASERASGVMIWELSQDTHDSTSLLAAIFGTIHP
jgi:chitinase